MLVADSIDEYQTIGAAQTGHSLFTVKATVHILNSTRFHSIDLTLSSIKERLVFYFNDLLLLFVHSLHDCFWIRLLYYDFSR